MMLRASTSAWARRLAASSVIVVFAAVAGATSASAQTPDPTVSGPTSAGGDTAVVAVNTRDDANVFRFALAIKRTMQDVVANSNAAAAVSSCSDCQTVAVSFQMVLIMSDPSVVAPENVAIALNVECSSCETLASAYQFVMTTGGPVRFTAEGNRALAELRQQLTTLLQSNASIEELHTAFEGIAARLAEILATELVDAGSDGGPTSSASSEPSPTTSIEPSPVEPSLTASSTTEPSDPPSSTPTATTSPSQG